MIGQRHFSTIDGHLIASAAIFPTPATTEPCPPRTVHVDAGVLLTREQRDRAVRESMWKGAEATTKRLGLASWVNSDVR